MSPAVIQDSTKCLGVTTKDMNIFLQTQSHPASPSHWFVAGFEALALAGLSPQCRWQGCPSMPFSPPTLAGWCGSQELVDKPVTESAEMGQALWKSASWLHRGELVGFQDWKGSFFSLLNPSVFPLLRNDTSTRDPRAFSFALPFPPPSHHQIPPTHFSLKSQSLPVSPSHFGHSYHRSLPGWPKLPSNWPPIL